MKIDLDPEDGMLSRKALAQEVLLFRMQMLAETFYQSKWVDGLEFDVWKMAHESPYKIFGNLVTDDMAKNYRDLAKIGEAWWVSPETVGKKGDQSLLIPIDEWETVLNKSE